VEASWVQREHLTAVSAQQQQLPSTQLEEQRTNYMIPPIIHSLPSTGHIVLIFATHQGAHEYSRGAQLEVLSTRVAVQPNLCLASPTHGLTRKTILCGFGSCTSAHPCKRWAMSILVACIGADMWRKHQRSSLQTNCIQPEARIQLGCWGGESFPQNGPKCVVSISRGER
jgi:hypothetical protein